MIAHLSGKIEDREDGALVLNVAQVGYEICCSARTLNTVGEKGAPLSLFIYTHYKSEGATLFGFLTKLEKNLFLALIKVDSVGPKTALNILSAAAPEDLIDLIEEGDVASLSRLPKISKKMAEHVVVKLKGKLSVLLLEPVQNPVGVKEATGASSERRSKLLESQKIKREALAVLVNLGYKTFETERVLAEIDDSIWDAGLETVIRNALSDLGGGR